MASEILVKLGTPITVACTSMGSLGTATGSHGAQTAKADLGAGTALMAQQYLIRLGTAFSVAPAAGAPVEVYVGFSSSTATTTAGAPAGLGGVDAAYTGYSNDVDVAKRQLTFVGLLAASAHTSAQVCDVGTFAPLDRYCQVVVANRSTQSLSSATASHTISIIPLKDEAQ